MQDKLTKNRRSSADVDYRYVFHRAQGEFEW